MNISQRTEAAIRRAFTKHGGDVSLIAVARSGATDAELKKFRAEILAASGEILAGAEAENRDLTKPETDDLEDMRMLASVLRAEIDLRDERSSAGTVDMRGILPDSDGGSGNRETTGHRFVDVKTGAAVRALGRKDSFAQAIGANQRTGISFGDFAARVITGRASPEAESEFRTMAISPSSSGGYAVPAPLSAQFIDKMRKQAAVVRAGALVVPMTSNTLTFAKNAGDPTVGWKSENSAFSASDMTLDAVTLTARVIGGYVKMSNELFNDAPNIGTAVENALAQGCGLELDRVCLVGSGAAPEPRGIYETSNVNSYTLDAALTNYDPVSRAVQLVREDNHEPTAMIAAPRTYGEFDRLKDTTNQPLQPPKSFTDLQHYASGNVPTDMDTGGSPANQTIAFVGDWSNVVIGLRNDIELLVTNTGGDGTTSGITHYQVFVRVVMRADVALFHPEAFAIIKKIWQTS
ncbi:MAG: phage major capsid protein [Ferrovibrio sp.]|uniref:phage major capsid protein n=1 Tax=Ferrovibrio sp. TaxID=1917215 RepID=UPI002628A332|nr:phage major capsid protein [Ferrovibrio sp.]MCW0235306.1 phage major capsid protein [Ferrovibrio sp.]